MEQRRHRRFDLHVPVWITLVGKEPVILPALTKNISSGGVLLTTVLEANVGGAVAYVVTMGDSPEQNATLFCKGTVLRCAQVSGPQQPVFEVAVTMQRYQFVRPESPGLPDPELANTHAPASRTRALTKLQRQQIARKAAAARWGKKPKVTSD